MDNKPIEPSKDYANMTLAELSFALQNGDQDALKYTEDFLTKMKGVSADNPNVNMVSPPFDELVTK